MNQVWELLNQYVSDRKDAPDGFSFNCPLCIKAGQGRNDTRKRGHASLKGSDFYYHCYNCSFGIIWNPSQNFSEKIRLLLFAIGVPEITIKQTGFEVWQNQRLSNIEGSLYVHKTEIKQIALPPNAKNILELAGKETNSLYLRAVNYLSNRGPAIYNNWQFFWSPSAELGMNQRIIIPYYDNGMIVGWSARLTRDQRTNEEPKYINKISGNYIFNIDRSRRSDRNVMIIQEGQLDAIVTDGVALMTNNTNQDKIDILNRVNKEKILIADRGKAGQKLIDIAIQNNWSVSFPPWEADIKDPADAALRYGRLYTVKSILDYRTDKKLHIEVLRKEWQRGGAILRQLQKGNN